MRINGEHFPDEIANNLNEYFPEFGGMSTEEILQQQESVYQSYQGQSDNRNQFSGQGSETSGHAIIDSQISLDELCARSLELEDHFHELNISESTRTATENREVISRETPITPINRNVTQDDLDPDNMTYEELLWLEESVGVQNRGLSQELISRLPNFKFKRGMCVICCEKYKDQDKLTTLPCAHQYHLKCIKRWLEHNKICPICKNEVSED